MNPLRLSVIPAACLVGAGLAWAASQVGPIPVTAQVDQVETLACSITTCTKPEGGDEICSGEVPTMNFGSLLRLHTCGVNKNEDCALMGAKHFKVFCGISTSQRPYTVKQTGGELRSGSKFLSSDAWIFAPGTCVDDFDVIGACNPLPSGASYGQKTTANSNGALWYNSGAGGKGVVIQGVYAITGNDADAVGAKKLIPPDQPTGTYTTQVTWTLTVNP